MRSKCQSPYAVLHPAVISVTLGEGLRISKSLPESLFSSRSKN